MHKTTGEGFFYIGNMKEYNCIGEYTHLDLIPY